jgi:hypothetical protein
VGIGLAAGLGLFTWWLVRGLGICPPKGNALAASCRAEASQAGLLFGTVVGGFIALVTIVVVLFNRGRGD